MTDRELMQQALEALEKTTANTISQAARIQEAITALRERLAQPEQEPTPLNTTKHQTVFDCVRGAHDLDPRCSKRESNIRR